MSARKNKTFTFFTNSRLLLKSEGHWFKSPFYILILYTFYIDKNSLFQQLEKVYTHTQTHTHTHTYIYIYIFFFFFSFFFIFELRESAPPTGWWKQKSCHVKQFILLLHKKESLAVLQYTSGV